MDEQNLEKIKRRVDLVLILYSFSQTARFGGLLAMEDYFHLAENNALRHGLAMTVQGEDPESVKAYYDNLIKAETDEDRRLELQSIQKGVSMVASGQEPENLRWQLSWQGTEEESFAVNNAVQEILMDHERDKHELFGEMTRVETPGDLAEQVETAFFYEFAWRPGMASSVVSPEVLCAAVRGCALDIQMRVVHLLPLLESNSFIKIYRSDVPSPEHVMDAMKEYMDWFRYVRGQGEYPGDKS